MEKKKGGMKKLWAKFETVKKQVDRVRKDGADVSLAVSLLTELDECLKKGDEAEATRILGNIDLMLKQAKAKKKYEMMIFNTLPMIEKAKRAGANVDASEAFLTKARELLDAGEFGDAHEQIKLARREADNAKHFMAAKSHILRVAPLVEAARKKGVNVRGATDILLEAWKALDGGNYDVVAELMKRAVTILNIAEEQKSYETSIRDMEARIAAVASSGVDTADMEALLGEAKLALEREEFGNVGTLVNKIRREIEKIILQREAGLTVRTIQQFVREAKRAGIKSRELDDLLEKASVAVGSGDFSQVRAIELSAKQAVKNLKLFDTLSAGDIGVMDKEREEGLMALIGEELAEYKRVADSARAGGMDVAEMAGLITATEDAMATGQLNTAFDQVKRLNRLMHEGDAGLRAAGAKKKLDELLATLEEARAAGIHVDEVETFVHRANRGDMEDEELVETIDRASSALEDSIKTWNKGRHPRLKVNVRSDGFEAQKWGQARVDISNTGNTVAKNVDISFFGDVEAKGWETIPRLLPGESDGRDVALKPFRPGKMGLDMTVSYEKSFDGTKFQLNDLKDMDVSEPGTFLVEDVFLIHNKGLLITKQTRRIREEIDGDLFSAMLTALLQFAKDSFNLEEKVALTRLEFGDNMVTIVRGRAFFVAVTILGEESAYMPFFISEVVGEVQEKYGDVLEDWNGDVGELEGIDLMVRKLLLVKSTESGTPDFTGSALHPALEAISNGTSVPDLEGNIKGLLATFEEELISGELEDAEDLAGSIMEAAEQGGGHAEGNRDRILRESMTHEIEVARRQLAGLRQASTDISAEEAMLSESLESLEKGEYEKVRGALTEIEELLRDRERNVTAQNLSGKLEELRAALAMASGMGLDVSDIECMTKEAEGMLASGPGPDAEGRIKGMADALEKKAKGFMANKYPRLHVDVRDARGHETGNWTKMGVVVTNRGNTPARNIDLNFSGDVEVRSPGPVDLIEPDASRDMEISVRPARSGELPLEISATYQRYFDDTKYQLSDMASLDVHNPGSYIVEDVFLIHNTGLLIARETRRVREEVDSDIFSAMLKAVTDFIGQAFNTSKEGGLDRMEFGGKKLLIEKGKFVFMTITISGEESPYLPLFMTELIRDIEDRYGPDLDNWNGEMKSLEGIQDMIKKIIFVRKGVDDEIPVFDSGILARFIGAADGGMDGRQIQEIETGVARIAEAVEGEGMDAALERLAEMEGMLRKLIPQPGTGRAGNLDVDTLKKRMYDIMLRAGRVDKDSALMDVRLNNYLEVVGKISDAVFGLRERNGIPLEQTLARVAIKHPDRGRWGEVLENMRSLVLEQANSLDMRVLGPDDVWEGLLPAVDIDEEHIRNSYKHIAKKIITILRHMPPDKLLANIKKGSFAIGVEGQQVYITDDMVSVSFSLPPGSFEGTVDSGTIYIDTVVTGESRKDLAVGELIEKILAMRREAEIADDAEIEVLIFACDALAETLEKAKNMIAERCGAYDVLFPLDDPFGDDDYYVGELELNGELCRLGIAQVEFDG